MFQSWKTGLLLLTKSAKLWQSKGKSLSISLYCGVGCPWLYEVWIASVLSQELKRFQPSNSVMCIRSSINLSGASGPANYRFCSRMSRYKPEQKKRCYSDMLWKVCCCVSKPRRIYGELNYVLFQCQLCLSPWNSFDRHKWDNSCQKARVQSYEMQVEQLGSFDLVSTEISDFGLHA